MTRAQLNQVVAQSQKQVQRLILSPQMQQALHLLQLPVLELTSAINDELTQNPILEYSNEEEMSENSAEKLEEEIEILRQIDEEFRDATFKEGRVNKIGREEEDLKSFLESSLAYELSLYDYLMQQAQDTFTTKEELHLANLLIGSIDEGGFFSSSIEEMAQLSNRPTEMVEEVLKQIQTFDPPGIGARNQRESLLIQLTHYHKEGSLAYLIVKEHYDALLHNKIPLIAKKCHVSPEQVRIVIEKEIAILDLCPGTNQTLSHTPQALHTTTPDVTLIQTENGLSIEVNEEVLPALRINHIYLKMLNDPSLPKETGDYIREKIASGKWLIRNICERHNTLHRIAEQIVLYQNDFLTHPAGKLTPLTMKQVAEKLELHESTIARAVANKFLSSPRGTFSFRAFFTHAYVTDSGEQLSSKTVKDLLIEIVREEDKKHPLSDETISGMIKEKGIPCARRTVAKYRQELNLGNTSMRRIY